ncbi:LysM peptidoglycan-binding domain-containing protein [Arthrobacter sp. NPDC090010]|uniref:LysM peptidoglycan-binding domain-containing protein n=1 Tax=Arthrobacter sp. NPDC090010 TaxID=3363942 RepID=UPI003815C703
MSSFHSPSDEAPPAHRVSHDVTMVALILLLGALLVWLGAASHPVGGGPGAPAVLSDGDSSVEALVGAAARWGGLSVIAWWGLSLVSAFLYAGMTALGSSGSARRIAPFSPAFMQRLAFAVLGLNLTVLPPAQAAGEIRDPSAAQLTFAPAQSDGSIIDRFGLDPAWTLPDEQPGPSLDPTWTPPPALTDSAPLLGPSWRVADGDSRKTREVAVRTGDCLWSVVSRHLGPDVTDLQVARAWPRWYAANKGVIGPDPDRLLPGTLLQPPPDAPEVR